MSNMYRVLLYSRRALALIMRFIEYFDELQIFWLSNLSPFCERAKQSCEHEKGYVILCNEMTEILLEMRRYDGYAMKVLN